MVCIRSDGGHDKLLTPCPLEIGGQSLDALYITRIRHFDHFGEEDFNPSRLLASQMAFANLGAHQLARPRVTKPFGRGLVRFYLWHFSNLPTEYP